MLLAPALQSSLIISAAMIAFGGWQPGHAQTVHAVLIGATNSSLADGAVENLKKMNNFVTSLKVVAKLKVTRTELREDAFTCANILSAIRKLKVKPREDAILFYYAGHGYRTKKGESKFPKLDCPHPPNKPPLELDDVVTRLNEKKPRFVLALADACNAEAEPTEVAAAQAPRGSEEDRRAGLRRLFLQYEGNFVMSAAKRGQPAWYMTEGDLLGGFFTNQFISVLNRRVAADSQGVRWEDIADQAAREIDASNDPQRPLLQKPESDVKLTLLPSR